MARHRIYAEIVHRQNLRMRHDLERTDSQLCTFEGTKCTIKPLSVFLNSTAWCLTKSYFKSAIAHVTLKRYVGSFVSLGLEIAAACAALEGDQNWVDLLEW